MPSKRILVVDDDLGIREAITDLLATEGYSVTSAASANAGLEALSNARFDLVITDYAMPDHNGAWLLQQAHERELLHGANTVVLTAGTDRRGLNDVEVLRKPVDIEHFITRVAQLTGAAAAELDAMKPTASPEATAIEKLSAAIHWVLYVSDDSPSSARSLEQLRTLKGSSPKALELVRIVNVASSQGAKDCEADRVSFTPTLVRRAPLPKAWFIGDQSIHLCLLELVHLLER